MNGDLGLKDIYGFIEELLKKLEFNLTDYFNKEKTFSELYNNSNETFYQVSVYNNLDSKREHHLENLKSEKVEEFKEKVKIINEEIEKFIKAYANNTEKVPSWEKDTFLYFRRVPSDFGLSYSIYERNKEREDREEEESRIKHMEESGLNDFIKKHGYNPCENCFKNCHKCNLGFYDDGRYSIHDVYTPSELGIHIDWK